MLSLTIRKFITNTYTYIFEPNVKYFSSLRFFFHYSGHGGRVHDVHSDEDDSYDETIYPLDFENFDGDSGQIKDDVRKLNMGAIFFLKDTNSF